ncbi:MAG: hypothetical protein HY341_01740 [Candidatus Kerfeldbacteria bacterium]|nr:hypothetical protein [Candidatus Kerfeldbacteria bacterium]
MARIHVRGAYTTSDRWEYVLTYYGGEHDGEEYLRLWRGKIFRLGKKQYCYVRAIRYCGENLLAVVRLDPGHERVSTWRLHRLYRGRRGSILWSNAVGTWATNIRDAREGSFQRVGAQDPFLTLLRDCGYHTHGLVQVPRIDRIVVKLGGRLCRHVLRGREGWTVHFDGKITQHLRDATYVETHHIRRHRGCQDNHAVVAISGGTFLVHWFVWKRNGRWGWRLIHLFVTPQAELRRVATVIENGPFAGLPSVDRTDPVLESR